MTGKPNGQPYILTKEYQTDFDDIKVITIQDALIAYPKYGEPFNVHTDVINY